MNRKPRTCGFTLVEILVVVVIMGIAAALTVPYVVSTSAVKLNASARTVMADLMYAQSRAIATRQRVYVVFTPASGSSPDQYQLKTQTSATDNSPGAVISRSTGSTAATMGRSGTELPAVQLGTHSSGSKSLTMGFDALGQPLTYSGSTTTFPTSNIQVQLASVSGSNTVTLSIQPFTGEVTVP